MVLLVQSRTRSQVISERHSPHHDKNSHLHMGNQTHRIAVQKNIRFTLIFKTLIISSRKQVPAMYTPLYPIIM